MSKVCGLAGMLFVLKLPRVTVDDIMVLYTSDLGFGWLLTKVVPSSWLRCQSFSGEIHVALIDLSKIGIFAASIIAA